MALNYAEKKQRETLQQDEKRNLLCTEHKKILQLIYYVGDRLISAPLLIDFLLLIEPDMTGSKAQRLISTLIKQKVLLQEYISLSYNPARTRILYLTKYATAHLKGMPNTMGADTLNKKHLSPEKIEKRVLRTTIIYNRFVVNEYKSVEDLLIAFKKDVSSYSYKQNQYLDYYLRIVDVFKKIPLHLIKREEINKYGYFLKQHEVFKTNGLAKGQKSKNNKSREIGTIKPKVVPFRRKHEWDADATLPKVLSNMDIASISVKDKRLNINVDYLVTTDKAEFRKIIKNLAILYKFFKEMVVENILDFKVDLWFVNELNADAFLSYGHKVKEGATMNNLTADLAKKGVLYTDAIKISAKSFG